MSTKKVSVHSRKIEIERGRYGVCKKEYWKFDCVDLYIELLILLNCELIGKCRSCTNLLKWIIDILKNKWDDIKFINFEKSLEIAKNIKSFVPRSVLEEHAQNRSKIKRFCKKAKVANNLDVILKNKKIFVDGENKHLQLRHNRIFNMIRSRDGLHKVNDFREDDLFENLTVLF